MSEKTVKIRLKGHETFILREGWLAKGLKAVADNSRVFSENAGADALGVGTNMAKAIRYWLRAGGITVESKGEVGLSHFGELIQQYDSCFEALPCGCSTATLPAMLNYLQAGIYFLIE